MTLLFYGLWMLCAFAGAVFAATALTERRGAAVAASTFVLTAVWLRPDIVIDPVPVGVLAALVAAFALAWPAQWIVTSLAAEPAPVSSMVPRVPEVAQILAVGAPVLALLLVWRRRHRNGV